ncbi:hypothetical protein ACHAWF_003099 [Thalassiosira exigua]
MSQEQSGDEGTPAAGEAPSPPPPPSSSSAPSERALVEAQSHAERAVAKCRAVWDAVASSPGDYPPDVAKAAFEALGEAAAVLGNLRPPGRGRPRKDADPAGGGGGDCPSSSNDVPSWNDMYFRLALYKSDEKDCDPPESYLERDRLGRWVAAQRKHFNNRNAYNDEDADRVKALHVLGFDFKVANERWEESYRKLAAFRAERPDAWPRAGSELGRWMHKQRSERTAHEKFLRGEYERPPSRGMPCSASRPHRMTQSRIDKLDALGFVWRAEWTKDKADWNARFEQLREFRRDHGHCRVPQHHKENKLGEWVNRMRYEHGLLRRGKKGRGALNEERMRKLNEIGFTWSVFKRKGRDGDEEGAHDAGDQEANSAGDKTAE